MNDKEGNYLILFSSFPSSLSLFMQLRYASLTKYIHKKTFRLDSIRTYIIEKEALSILTQNIPYLITIHRIRVKLIATITTRIIPVYI
jgi:hypothetical protein